jgi:DNA-binding MarR family transcriptional regulator
MVTNPDAVAISNPFDDHLGYRLRRASNLVMTMLAEDLGELQLTIVETSVLVLIDRNPGIFQSEIGRVLGIKRANVAPLAASLERRGLVRRSSAEGRLVGLSTTEAGQLLATRAAAIMQDNDRRLFDRLDPAQREALSDGLGAIWQAGD